MTTLADHAADAADVAAALCVDPHRGLSGDEVLRRRARFGANVVVRDAGRPIWLLFVRQFRSVIIALLAVAAALAFVPAVDGGRCADACGEEEGRAD